MIRQWFRSGDPWVWMAASAVSISMILVFGLLLLIAARGLGHFWPSEIVKLDYRNQSGEMIVLQGEIHDRERVTAERLRDAGYPVEGDQEVERFLLKMGNRDLTGQDFRWVVVPGIIKQQTPSSLMTVERREWGNLYGELVNVKQMGAVVADGTQAWSVLQKRLQRADELFQQIRDIERGEIGSVNYDIEKLRLHTRSLELKGQLDISAKQLIKQQRAQLDLTYKKLQIALEELYKKIRRDSITVVVAGGEQIEWPVAKIVKVYRPNDMNVLDKSLFYIAKLYEFVSDDPREANTEGGIFPAIFGTIMMVIIMSIIVVPFGVVAAVYLREYASQGPMIRLIRIAVNNLAGVPSIVYGVFGLGFFVYFLGGNIDQLFYPEALPAPTFGTPGLMWASLTLALLTVPVVIVATEEGLSRIPKSIREGSLALGATKAETLWRTVLPMASPAIMTGMIMAIARAAGEVAPLMLVGVVKLAPTLPLDGNMPFLHLDRKFMHMGFHIYDVGFQSPNVEAARPLVYATALLLVIVIVALNMTAIAIRNHLREKYRALEN